MINSSVTPEKRLSKMVSRIYFGQVFHKRYFPKKHALKYAVCSFLFDLDELNSLDKDISFFSVNKANLISFWPSDFGVHDGFKSRNKVSGSKRDNLTPEALKARILNFLELKGIALRDGSIQILCYPRMFGYAFNPLTIYFCHDEKGNLKAIIYEVSNTFGQRHNYVIKMDCGLNELQNTSLQNQTNSFLAKHSCEKNFYVSPFIEMNCAYQFSILPPQLNIETAHLTDDKIKILIRQKQQGERLLTASFTGKSVKMTAHNLIKVLCKFPFMTFKVMAGIHWEALKIWCKGVDYVPRPAPPQTDSTVVLTQQKLDSVKRDRGLI